MIKELILQSIKAKMAILQDEDFLNTIEEVGALFISTLKQGKKILIMGNGGSAADAQHFAAELAGKFLDPNRRGLPVIALATNTSILTAIGNDFSYDVIFSRQIEGLGQKGDVIIGISTSGNSKNILIGLEQAKQQGLQTIGLLGNSGGIIKNYCDLSLTVPSANTQSIQESHIMIIHILCAIVDKYFS